MVSTDLEPRSFAVPRSTARERPHRSRRVGNMARRLFALLALATSVFVGCKGVSLDELLGPQEGDPCDTDAARCLDGKRQLWCVNGRFVQRACSGPDGCKTNQASNLITCDWELDLVGTRCSASEERNGACTADGKAMLRCDLGEIKPWGCTGPEGCTELANGKISCDGSRGTVGGSCALEGPACDVDGKTALVCKNGVLSKDGDCRGPDGCKSFLEGDGWRVECDRSIAAVGDVCPSAGAACSQDERSFLECRGGQFVSSMRCLGKDGCHEKGGNIYCDSSIGNVGDVCSDGAACAEDGKSILTCKDGKLVTERKCSCVVESEFVTCK